MNDTPTPRSGKKPGDPPTYLTKRPQGHGQPREIKSAVLKVMSSDLVRRKCKLTVIPDEHFYDDLSNQVLRALQSVGKEFHVDTVIKKDQGGTLHSLFETDLIVLANAIRETLIRKFKLPPNELPVELILQAVGIDSESKSSGATTPILMVEDNPRTARIAQLLLAKNGITAHIAPHAKLAVEILDKQPVELILMDYNLPGPNGGEFVGMLKNTKRFSSIPIIMASAMSDEAIIRTCLKNGAVDFIVKPFKGETLLEKIKKHTGRPKAD